MIARGNHGHVPEATALKKKPAKHEGRRRRAGGATSRQSRSLVCQSLLTFLTRPSLTRRIASQLTPDLLAGASGPWQRGPAAHATRACGPREGLAPAGP